MMYGLDEVRRVTDHELLSRLERLVRADRAISVKLLVHLGEVEARKLFLERGFSSMYDYCMSALGMSEGETYLRLLAAKTGKRLPLVLERLADGGLHLTAIKLLAPLLTEENHVALLDRARGMSKRQLEVLVAELAPKADVPELLRKLPAARGAAAVAARMAASVQGPRGGDGAVVHAAADDGGAAVLLAANGGVSAHSDGGGAAALLAANGGVVLHVATDSFCQTPAARAGDGVDVLHTGGAPAAPSHASTASAAQFVLQPCPARSSISPLSPGRFKLELTLGQEAYDQLAQLRELLRHQNPSGEIARIVERALRELLERTLKQRFAQTASPKPRGARAQKAHALDRVAERKAGAADEPETQSRCSALDRQRGGAAHSGDSPAPDQQPTEARGAVRRARAADAPETQPRCSALDRQRGGAAHSGDSAAPGQEVPDARAPVARGAGPDVAREPRAASSRYVPRAVLREVYARDAGQCTYVSPDGRRCSARGFLEVHHHKAFARGGEATVDNLRLSCRAHNFWLAERELGPGFVHGKLLQRGARLCAP
jgi:hypothetical protein